MIFYLPGWVCVVVLVIFLLSLVDTALDLWLWKLKREIVEKQGQDNEANEQSNG